MPAAVVATDWLLLAAGCWLLAAGCLLLAGCWLVAGCWLAAGWPLVGGTFLDADLPVPFPLFIVVDGMGTIVFFVTQP